jgi:hypothetical protein
MLNEIYNMDPSNVRIKSSKPFAIPIRAKWCWFCWRLTIFQEVLYPTGHKKKTETPGKKYNDQPFDRFARRIFEQG